MIKFEDVSFGFAQKELYDQISFEINMGDHAVLIGSNGTGKSTLISMILDREKYLFDGRIEMPEGIRVGYVSQYMSHEGNEKVFDYLSAPFIALLSKAEEAANAMAEAEDMDAAFETFQMLQDEIESMDAYNYEVNIRKQLAMANLEDLADHSVDQISGGEFKLISIIRNMLVKPNLLIMDEPDVFLDFENLVGLSRLINGYEGTLLAVTHNRLLLSQCFDKILHIENGELQEFPGSFAEYTSSMLETKTLTAEQAKKDEEWIEIQKQVVDRIRKIATANSAPKLGAQVHARASYLERLQARKAENPFLEDRNFDLCFPETEEDDSQLPAISIRDYSLAYDKVLLSDVNFEIHAGEKVALVGANGTGKSSLLKDIISQVENTEAADDYAYFSQIYDESTQASGGEQNISRLREICCSKAGIILLDEPSSHLDIYAQRALENAIKAYRGTVLMVSHDFYTVANCADRILMLEDGTLKELSPRAFRKRIYKQYFSSDIFEQEKQSRELEIRINSLLKNQKIKEAKEALGL